MVGVLTVLVALTGAYAATFLYALTRNYWYARRTGFPYIVVPWDQNHFVWMIVSVPLRPYLRRWLPRRVFERLTMTIYGWEFHERLRPFKQWCNDARSFVLVTCGMTEFYTSDAEVVSEILRRPRDFQQLELSDLFMARFGHNLLTSNGDRWARQRRIVASVINERISKAVWNESKRQTEGLVKEVHHRSDSAESNRVFEMIKKVTIHVLSGAGMGESVSFSDDATAKPKPGFRMSYIEAVKVVINNVAGPIILPQWFLSNYPRWLPGYENLKALSFAVEEFPKQTRALLNQERQRQDASHAKEGDTKSNIMSQLLQASEGGTNAKGKVLSDEETMGNLFIFTAAGFDTTANTLAYAVALLARFPRWQDWLAEEVDRILPADVTNDELDYTAVFPKAVRTLAFMFETLRLFTPLIHLSKQTKLPQTIETSHGKYWLPANATVYINTVTLHLAATPWRNLNLAEGEERSEEDETRFRPTRWVNPLGSARPHFEPENKGAFVAWSTGPRVCPGMKMAQVEFVAVILILLRHHRIEAVHLPGEDQAQMQKRLDSRMRDSISILTLQMNGVYDVKSPDDGLKLRLVKR